MITDVGKYCLVLKKLDTKPGDKNEMLVLPHIPMKYGGTSFPFKLTRLHPLKITFTLTINRAQGQSASRCGILLPQNVWTHGQIYVTLSRCGIPNNIFVWAEQEQFESFDLPPGRKFIKSVVYNKIITDP